MADHTREHHAFDPEGDEEYGIQVTSLYGMMRQEGAVEMICPEKRVVMRPSDALALALSLLEAAAGADTDAFLVDFFGRRLGMDPNELGKIIAAHRAFVPEPESGPETGREYTEDIDE